MRDTRINKLFATVVMSMGQRLRQLYDEVYNQDQSKTPEEVIAILEKLNMLCEDIDKQYSGSTYLSILLDSAGGNAALYFHRYSEYLKELHHKASKSKKILQNLNNTKQKKAKNSSPKVFPYSTRIYSHDQIPKKQPLKNKIAEIYTQDAQIEKHIHEYSLFSKYQDAKKDSVEYVKNDFMNHYDPSKHQSLDEVILERSQALHMSTAKYKEDLIYGSPSKMETLVNLIEPGWSKLPPPVSETDNITLKSK